MKKIKVVCGVVFMNSKVLITQRGYGPLKGKWEFPGGKVEPNETPMEALERELLEELNVKTKVKELILKNEILISDNKIELLFYRVEILEGEIELKAHINYLYVEPNELQDLDLLDGDIPMMEYLCSI